MRGCYRCIIIPDLDIGFSNRLFIASTEIPIHIQRIPKPEGFQILQSEFEGKRCIS